MNRKYSLLLVLITAVFELAFLVWTRADYRSTLLDGEEYEVPAAIEFHGNFYDRKLTQPSGSYIKTRALRIMDGTVYFNFPADRMYMAPEQLKKLSVVELSERVQVPEDNGKTKTAMKNEITALVRVKDGRAAVSRVLANGGPVEQIFTTVGKNLSVKYATSKDEKDQYNEKRFFTAADMDKNGKESDN